MVFGPHDDGRICAPTIRRFFDQKSDRVAIRRQHFIQFHLTNFVAYIYVNVLRPLRAADLPRKMVRKHTLDTITTLTKLLKRCARKGDRRGLQKTKRVLLQILVFSHIENMRAPRYPYVQADFPETSMWDYLREHKRDGAFMRFLGFPHWAFMEIAERCRKFLPQYDLEARAAAGTPGVKPLYDYIDCTAIALRRLRHQRDLTERLQVDFFRNDSTLGRYVAAGKAALSKALDEWPEAAVRYPTN